MIRDLSPLAALTPLRTLLPAAPPIESWIDIYVFFWVGAGKVLVGSMFRRRDT